MSDDIYKSVWPGLNSYTEQDKDAFFGRDDEIAQLEARIREEPLCILYGPSGAGKTSLLQAGVFPRIRTSCLMPVYVRLNHSAGTKTYSSQIFEAVLAAAETSDIEMRELCPSMSGERRETLWEWFHRHIFLDEFKETISPVLVFDQFEEIFTLGIDDKDLTRDGWLSELADLCANNIPSAVVKDVRDGKRLEFNTGVQTWRVIITLREDFLPRLEERTVAYPIFRKNRIAIGGLNEKQALEAIVRPGKDIVDAEVASAVIDYIKGASGKIETPLLSLFCSRLDILRQRKGLQKITSGLVEESRDDILVSFYDESMGRLSEHARDFLEKSLLNANGSRVPLEKELAVRNNDVTEIELRNLIDRDRILHVIRRDNKEWVELSHDVLVPVARAGRERRRRELERRALQDKVQRQRNRIRRMSFVLGGMVALLCLAAFSWWFFFAREYTEHYRAWVKKWGHPVGVGKPLSAEVVSHRYCSFKLYSHGKYALALDWGRWWWPFSVNRAPVYKMVAVDGDGHPTTKHGMGTYLWRGEDLRGNRAEQVSAGENERPGFNGDDTAGIKSEPVGSIGISTNIVSSTDNMNAGKSNVVKSGAKTNAKIRTSRTASSERLRSVCMWEFTYGADGRPLYEVGLDASNKVVWAMQYYSRGNDDEEWRRKSLVHFVMEDGYPMRQREDNAEYVQLNYDPETGFETLIEYKDQLGNHTAGPDGAKAFFRKYDEDGREILFGSQDWSGTEYTNMMDRIGNTGWKKTYAKDWSMEIGESFLFSVTNTCKVQDGYVKHVLRYDSWGNRMQEDVYALPGQGGVFGQTNAHHVCCVFDARGNATNLTSWAEDGTPTNANNLAHRTCREYRQYGDESKCIREWYLDAGGNPVANEIGIVEDRTMYDAAGVMTKSDYYAPQGKGGIWGYTNVHHVCRLYDAYGNETNQTFWAADETPTIGNNNAHRTCREYRQYGGESRYIREWYLDAGGNPVANENGIVEDRAMYDAAGVMTKIDYYAPQGKGGIWGHTNVHHVCRLYDAYGNETNQSFWAADETPTLGNFNVHQIRKSYDESNREIEEWYFAGDGKSAMTNNAGVCGGTISYHGPSKFFARVIAYGLRECPFVDGSPGVWRRDSLYDIQGRQTNECHYSVHEKHIPNKDGCAEIRKVYDSAGGLTQVDLYALPGQGGVWGYTNVHHVCRLYDVYGNETNQTFWAVDGSPTIGANNAHRTCREYLRYEMKSRTIREWYLNGEGHPTLDSRGVAEWKYDDTGDGKIIYLDVDGAVLKMMPIVIFEEVQADSMGERLGVHVGDVVCRFGKYSVREADDFEKLKAAILTLKDTTKTLEIARRTKNGIYEIHSFVFPPGKMGLRFVDTKCRSDWYSMILETYCEKGKGGKE